MPQLINQIKQKMLHVSCYMLHEKGFTLIEILVVTTIISLLAGTGLVSYSSFTKNSRDARRKADLEQIRAALEMYRSNMATYPIPAGGYGLPFGTGALTDGTNTYLQKIPQDPKSPQTYYYGSTDGYTLGAKLEGSSTSTSCGDCETTAGSQPCNYCLGPYGQR